MTRPLDQRLANAGDARREAERVRHLTAQELHALVKDAANLGYTKTGIAEITGLSRQTVHEILRD